MLKDNSRLKNDRSYRAGTGWISCRPGGGTADSSSQGQIFMSMLKNAISVQITQKKFLGVLGSYIKNVNY